MLDFHTITQADRDQCMKLFEMAGWGNTVDDFRRMLHYAPDGCFIAEGEIGMVSTVNYGSVGWIGNLIVNPDNRNRGIGAELMKKAIKHLRESGVSSIRLDAVQRAVSLYRRLGFKMEFRSLRYRGTAQTGKGRRAANMIESDLEDVIELDESYFGTNRGVMLKRVYAEYPEHCFTVWDNSKIEGYIMAKMGDPVNRVGPWICNPEKPELAGQLWNSLMQSFEGEEMWIGIPEENRTSVDIVEATGFIEQPSAIRMCLGECKTMGDVYGRFSIGAPDKG